MFTNLDFIGHKISTSFKQQSLASIKKPGFVYLRSSKFPIGDLGVCGVTILFLRLLTIKNETPLSDKNLPLLF